MEDVTRKILQAYAEKVLMYLCGNNEEWKISNEWQKIQEIALDTWHQDHPLDGVMDLWGCEIAEVARSALLALAKSASSDDFVGMVVKPLLEKDRDRMKSFLVAQYQDHSSLTEKWLRHEAPKNDQGQAFLPKEIVDEAISALSKVYKLLHEFDFSGTDEQVLNDYHEILSPIKDALNFIGMNLNIGLIRQHDPSGDLPRLVNLLVLKLNNLLSD